MRVVSSANWHNLCFKFMANASDIEIKSASEIEYHCLTPSPKLKYCNKSPNYCTQTQFNSSAYCNYNGPNIL